MFLVPFGLFFSLASSVWSNYLAIVDHYQAYKPVPGLCPVLVDRTVTPVSTAPKKGANVNPPGYTILQKQKMPPPDFVLEAPDMDKLEIKLDEWAKGKKFLFIYLRCSLHVPKPGLGLQPKFVLEVWYKLEPVMDVQ